MFQRGCKVTSESFQNPPGEYRGAPMWAWNTELNQETMEEQMRCFARMGFGGFLMHTRVGLATEYMGKEFMDGIRFCVEQAKELGLKSWLYDEDPLAVRIWWRQGDQDARYGSRFLLFTPFSYESGKTGQTTIMAASTAGAERTGQGRLLACFDIELDERARLKEYHQIDREEPAAGTKWYAYLETAKDSPWFNNQAYVNTLDPLAVQRFLEVTHEKYAAVVGGDFGQPDPGCFYR